MSAGADKAGSSTLESGMEAASPCIGTCRIDADGLCAGCARTLDEIARWGGMDIDARLRVLAQLRERRAAIECGGAKR